LHNFVFNSEIDPFTLRRLFPFSSTLVLPGFNILEALNIKDPQKAEWQDYVFRARGRDLSGAIFEQAKLLRIDFSGADLQGALFGEAELQGASFFRAQLQGAKLSNAQLRGALFDTAWLQGAHLDDANLLGASFNGAQLQGASLFQAQLQGAFLGATDLRGALLGGAQLQGTSLMGAQLQGSSLFRAHLEGASLDGVRLEGASLREAWLWGSALQGAVLQATDLSGAFLWRTNSAARVTGDNKKIAAVLLPVSANQWLPIWSDGHNKVMPLNNKVYENLHQAIESLPPGYVRNQALENIQGLDCANPDAALASCDPSVLPPPEAAAWRKSLEDARVDEPAYTKSLATSLNKLVCSGGDSAAFVLGGIASPFSNRLAAAGPDAPALIDFIMSKDCPVSTALTDSDRANLLQIKQQAEKAVK
jgi:uncharacterized protein YjbI with pentapeptide repeats